MEPFVRSIHLGLVRGVDLATTCLELVNLVPVLFILPTRLGAAHDGPYLFAEFLEAGSNLLGRHAVVQAIQG